jgi:ABC-type nickel/cobalt efflux system permease component RcnA
MRRLLRLLPLLIAALWLPLQTVAAAAMPFCAHGPMVPQQDHARHAVHDHDRADVAHDHHAAQETAPLACDACGTCHLASASVLPASAMTRHAPDLSDTLTVLPAPTFASHIPVPQDRPPRIA